MGLAKAFLLERKKKGVAVKWISEKMIVIRKSNGREKIPFGVTISQNYTSFQQL